MADLDSRILQQYEYASISEGGSPGATLQNRIVGGLHEGTLAWVASQESLYVLDRTQTLPASPPDVVSAVPAGSWVRLTQQTALSGNIAATSIPIGASFTDIVSYPQALIVEQDQIRTFGLRITIYEDPATSDFAHQEDIVLQTTITNGGMTLRDKSSGTSDGPSATPQVLGTFDDSNVDWTFSFDGTSFTLALAQDATAIRYVYVEGWKGTLKELTV
jgi:hypothetical protein